MTIAGLDPTQQRNIQRVVNRIRYRFGDNDESRRMTDIAIETVLTESNGYMYANRYNADSLRLPHDKVGQDHASVGLYQQQPQWWGNVRDLMNIEKSTDKFIDALRSKPWKSVTNWQAAQMVQVSAFPDGSNYRANDARAISIRRALWSAPSPKPASLPRTYKVVRGDTLSGIAGRFKTTVRHLVSLNRAITNPDRIYIGQKIRVR